MSKEMRNVKEYLFNKYGLYCEVCGKRFDKNGLTGHHIVMKCKGGKISKKNILLACYHCHFGVINNMEYNTEEYWTLMLQSLKHRDPEDKEDFFYPNQKKR